VSKNRGDDIPVAKVWDLSTSKEAFSLQGDFRFWAMASHMSYSPDGNHLVCSSGNETRVWNARTGELLWTIAEGVGHVAWSFDGQYLAGCGWMTVKVWNLATRKELFSFKGHTAALRSVAFSPDGDRLVSTANDNTVRIWDLKTGSWGQEGTTLVGSPLAAVIFSPDGRYVSACSDKLVQVWDLHSHSPMPVFRLDGHTASVVCAAFSLDGQHLASGSFDGEVKVWDFASAREKTTLPLGGRVYSLAFSPDGRRLAAVSAGGPAGCVLKIWDLQTRESFALPGQAISLAFSRDGRKLVGGGEDIIVWDTANWQPILTLPGASITSVALSSNGKLVAGASYDRSIKIWDAESGQLLFTLEGHTSEVRGLAFSPDGTRLASAGSDATRIWDVGLGQQALAFKGSYSSVAFSPDRTRLAGTFRGNNTLRIWDATPPQAKELAFPQTTPKAPFNQLVTGAIEAERMRILRKNGLFYAGPQDMRPFPDGRWSGNSQLFVKPPQGAWVDLELPVPGDGSYHVIVYLTKAPDYGIIQFHLDGKQLGKPIDCFQADRVIRTGAIDLGEMELKKGNATMRVEVVGTNPKSVGWRYMWGLDCVVLKKRTAAAPLPQGTSVWN
jgi:WD40 repeat protein